MESNLDNVAINAPGRIIGMREPPEYGKLRLDYVGKIYFTVFAVWTSIFSAALIAFLKYRRLSFIRLKNVPLVVAALLMLHIQLTFDLLAYPLNGVLPCSLEYWIMNLCLPLGIALFQAQNMQLFSTFYNQQHLLQRSAHKSPIRTQEDSQGREKAWVTKNWQTWQGMCYLRRTYYLIGLGICLQVTIGLIIFLISKKFHPTFGLVSFSANGWQCRAGWEWFPSGIWQALWTWVVGPLILYKIRHIQDTHHWKLQTTLSILFSLPALPLWASTMFLPSFYPTHPSFPPTLWFVPGLAAMQFTILFFPLYGILSLRRRAQKVAFHPQRSSACAYSLAALERALRDDIERLEQFAAEKDFSGENIIFLKRVENWKDRWTRARLAAESKSQPISQAIEQSLWTTAEQIWLDCISSETSPFPVNIDERVYLALQRIFAPTTPPTKFSLAIIAPFASPSLDRDFDTPPTPPRKNSVPFSSSDAAQKAAALLWGRRTMKPLPRGFGENVFEEAEREVKQMVLENTWVRYVDCTENIVGEKEARDEEALRERARSWKGRVRGWRWRR